MIAEIISVGTEILMGNIINTNAKYLSEKLASLGISVYYQITVGDNKERLKQTIETALSRSDFVILGGGLGPTEDDLTKETTAEVLHRNLVMDPHTKERMEEYFKNSIYKEISPNNWKQADIIEGACVLDNDNGTAPGLLIKNSSGKQIILLPGPPNEMIPMFESKVVPLLSDQSKGILFSKMVKICGIGESMVETMIKDLIDGQTNPTIAPYAKTGEVHLRVTALAENEEEGKALVSPVLNELYHRFENHIFTEQEEETLESYVVSLLKKKGLTITTAESCTGGYFTGRIVKVAGASAVLKAGFITYADEAKVKYLSVSEDTLKNYGAVSKQTAIEMAAGAAKAAGADTAIAITGIAGPDGGSSEKPVGTVYIGCFVLGRVTVKHYIFKGNREKVREYAVQNALDLLRLCLADNKI